HLERPARLVAGGQEVDTAQASFRSDRARPTLGTPVRQPADVERRLAALVPDRDLAVRIPCPRAGGLARETQDVAVQLERYAPAQHRNQHEGGPFRAVEGARRLGSLDSPGQSDAHAIGRVEEQERAVLL